MPRAKRLRVSGVPQLLSQVGHNGAPVFLNDSDYRTYLRGLKESALATGCRVHAYSLAPDNLYVLCTPTRDDGVSRMMQGVAAKYAYHFNRAHGRSGSLWDGRYRACLIEPGRFLLASYLFVDCREDSGPAGSGGWSSCCHHAHGRPDFVVDDHWVYRRLAPSARARQRAYRELLELGISASLRAEIECALHSNVVLGEDAFKDQIASRGYARVRVGKPGRPTKSAPVHGPHRAGPMLRGAMDVPRSAVAS